LVFLASGVARAERSSFTLLFSSRFTEMSSLTAGAGVANLAAAIAAERAARTRTLFLFGGDSPALRLTLDMPGQLEWRNFIRLWIHFLPSLPRFSETREKSRPLLDPYSSDLTGFPCC
jgi:hypothetical protein